MHMKRMQATPLHCFLTALLLFGVCILSASWNTLAGYAPAAPLFEPLPAHPLQTAAPLRCEALSPAPEICSACHLLRHKSSGLTSGFRSPLPRVEATTWFPAAPRIASSSRNAAAPPRLSEGLHKSELFWPVHGCPSSTEAIHWFNWSSNGAWIPLKSSLGTSCLPAEQDKHLRWHLSPMPACQAHILLPP